MVRRHAARPLLAILAALPVIATGAAMLGAQQRAASEIEGRKSGYLFLTESTRALQDDDFQNPAMFAVEKGRSVWRRTEGPQQLSCASCHGADATPMRGIAARYPVYDATRMGLVNLELRINQERTIRMGAPPLSYESEDMIALTAFVSMQSRGLPMAVGVSGPAQPYFERGRAFWTERRGQLDLACTHCHDDLVGRRLRGDLISQGQVNGFPIYRLGWRAMASRHRLFEWCNTSVRAEPYAYGSEEYLALELYTAWRGRGLPIEAPAVRR